MWLKIMLANDYAGWKVRACSLAPNPCVSGAAVIAMTAEFWRQKISHYVALVA